MSLTTCNLHFTQQPDKVIYVSSSLMKSLNLSGKKRFICDLGGTGCRQPSSQSEKQANIYILPQAFAT